MQFFACTIIDDDSEGEPFPFIPPFNLDESNQLIIATPPGDSIGLNLQGQHPLRVYYQSAQGIPILGALLVFEIVVTGREGTGGATLSSSRALTDHEGFAEVMITAGSQEAIFHVEVSAPQAPSVAFFIAVTNNGFADFVLLPVHRGPRPQQDFVHLEFRLYSPMQLSCANAHERIDDLPAPMLPPRTLPGFEGRAAIPNLLTKRSYTVLAWASQSSAAPRVRHSFGCVELGPEQVLPGPLQLALVLYDRTPQLSYSLHLQSDFDFSLLRSAIAHTEGQRPWQILSCPVGRAQLLLDCIANREADNDRDCIATNTTELRSAIESRRGPVDRNGCRPAFSDNQQLTLDGLLDNILTGESFFSAAGANTLAAVQEAILAGAQLTSEFSMPSASHGQHVLKFIEFGNSSVGSASFSLANSSRPIIEQRAIDVEILPEGAQNPQLRIASHAFTLRLKELFRAALIDLALAQQNLEGQVDTLGSALVNAAQHENQHGCEAISRVLCTALSQPRMCVNQACSDVGADLNRLFSLFWQLFAAEDSDFVLTGTLPTLDLENDLSLDTVGSLSPSAPSMMRGNWNASFWFNGSITIEGVRATIRDLERL